MTLKDVHYFVHDLNEITCDGCGGFLCFGFIDYADDSGFLCPVCQEKKQIEQAPEVERQQLEMLMRCFSEIECGSSAEGHDWLDVTSSSMVFGSYVFSCTKCPAEKTEPMEIAWKELKIGEGEIKI